MNASTQLSAISTDFASPTALILNRESMQSMTDLAAMMAGGKTAVPQHFRGNQADCMAIVMQSMQWGISPFAVAQKTHLTQGGALGYEAQLINAVVISRAPIQGRPEYEYLGDWDKILGRVTENKSEKGGKYYTAAWKKDDEAGLGIIVRLTMIGESKPREVKVMMSQAYPRFSTQWATDPKQQIAYLAIRKWARLHTPDVILGVYTNDEMPAAEEIDVTPRGEAQASTKPADVAASAVPQGDQTDASADLFEQLKKTAQEEGLEGYEKAWKGLKPAQRGAIGVTRHNELKTIAQTIEAEFTTLNDGADHSDDDQQGGNQ
ncbi:recombinase RecT [Pseudomonas sp. ArH3a]|uniref:RecT family recombinase n=1 Tax=Pseudomonas sp. ArH3a TaxID=2862945 RepID=UPI001F575B98|nr:RecT family recombinase [Pseudomonas sp. ArH3a]UNM17322.1 recombinase RecT [Pseudomonas sp. ArH3a]